jgi:hypothetical protein
MFPVFGSRTLSTLAAFGQRPTPLMVWVSPVFAEWRMTGATPPTFTRSGSRMPMQMPAVTPASIALPPRSRIRWPASAAR